MLTNQNNKDVREIVCDLSNAQNSVKEVLDGLMFSSNASMDDQDTISVLTAIRNSLQQLEEDY